jgi:hypothetical protein
MRTRCPTRLLSEHLFKYTRKPNAVNYTDEYAPVTVVTAVLNEMDLETALDAPRLSVAIAVKNLKSVDVRRVADVLGKGGKKQSRML